jgi:hypothetical protein
MKYIYEENDIKGGLLVSNGKPCMIVAPFPRDIDPENPKFAMLDLQTGTLLTAFADVKQMSLFLTGNSFRPLRTEQVFNEEEY